MAKFNGRTTKGLNTFKPSRREIPSGKFEMCIDALADDGRGIARVNGKAVFVKNALPGETVFAAYCASHRQFDEAETVSIMQASDQRIEPPCRYFGDCGGCSLQHLAYPQQLAFKQEKIRAMLNKTSLGLRELSDAPVLSEAVLSETIVSPPFHYRHRARFSVAAGKVGVKFGFKKAESNHIVMIEECQLLQTAVTEIIEDVAVVVASLHSRSAIDQVVIVEDSDQQLALWIAVKRSLPDADLQRLAAECGRLKLLAWVSSVEQPSSILWSNAGANQELVYRVASGGLALNYLPMDFTQVNPEVNAALVDTAINWLDLLPEDSVVDCFCGIGNFSLAMAGKAGSVTGIEISSDMVSRAASNAVQNNISNTEFVTANLMSDSLFYSAIHNKALLDPPRAGAASVCRHIYGWGVKQLVYVSCNPNTFFRDAEILQQQGYVLERLAVADMFPQTAHIELLSLFRHH